ncbi:kinase-like protein [Annulohypoxylon maeteangense]|uniref:kinase-like protein n=1 Tax=Annulohypoxylon maeteangense TaxID=1927788 RepID=UPI0020072987|nr:kinase-like protein [Annulohypoxylon maeteangense]KAI0882718.1 kinase-like protein [Annulohypoxylon maeteangense]
MHLQNTNGVANGQLGQLRHIPLSYDSENPDSSARALILALRPEWSSPDSKIEFISFKDGITNTLLKAINKKEGLSKDEVDKEAVLLRAYGHGTDVLIDRHRETQNHELLMNHDLAPELLARFDNGMIYRYIRGTVTQPADLRESPIYLAVARRLAQWHAIVPCIYEAHPLTNGVNGDANASRDKVIAHAAPGKPSPNVWTVMQKWIFALPTDTEAQRTRQADLQQELTKLIEELSERPGLGDNGLVFAHCDLLSGNVIIEPQSTYTKEGGEQQKEVSFIDYEYATPSPAAFDLANHFAEWGGFDCDYNVLPTRAQRLEFIREYIHTYFSLLPDKPINIDEEAETQKLLAEIDIFRGVPGFYWGIWALIQATISHIDFDYAEYAEIRLGEYWGWREAIKSAENSSDKELSPREKRWMQLK